jgi:CubicO group peptidase (beta-lactamase class C family)
MRLAGLVLCLLAACKSKSEPPKQAPPPAPGDAAATADAVPATLEGELTAIKTKLELPAIAAAAWRDGKLVEQAAIGERKVGDAAKVTLDDRWHIGSNTKAMTAALIGIYVDRGTLRWTDTIGQLLGPAKIDSGYKNVTLDQLIRHEGGAPAEPPKDLWMQLWTDGTAPDARSKFVAGILATKPAQAPGTFTYSNASYMIAAAMLEAKTKKRWEELIKTDVFDKLEMKSCGFGPPGTKGVVDQPRGHDGGGTALEPGPAADNPPGLGPAGTVHCSLADYGKFLNVLATGQPALVTPETMQHLTTARAAGDMGYAGGWMVVTKPSKGTMLVHSGSNTMWYVTAVVIPAKQLAFVVATNKGDPSVEESLETLLARYQK